MKVTIVDISSRDESSPRTGAFLISSLIRGLGELPAGRVSYKLNKHFLQKAPTDVGR